MRKGREVVVDAFFGPYLDALWFNFLNMIVSLLHASNIQTLQGFLWPTRNQGHFNMSRKAYQNFDTRLAQDGEGSRPINRAWQVSLDNSVSSTCKVGTRRQTTTPSICLRFVSSPCWFYKDFFTTGHMCLFSRGLNRMEDSHWVILIFGRSPTPASSCLAGRSESEVERRHPFAARSGRLCGCEMAMDLGVLFS